METGDHANRPDRSGIWHLAMGSRQESLSRSAEPVAALVLPIAVWMVAYDEDHHDNFRIPQIHLHHVPDPRRYVVRPAIPGTRDPVQEASAVYSMGHRRWLRLRLENDRSRRRDRLEDPLAATRCAGSMSVQLGSLQSALLVHWVSKPERHRGQAESRKSEMAAMPVGGRPARP